ncbi:hypothetical protein [Vreelandella profundi]|uniref:hypothetical protein n=1 Tax=Vreelandella profundi TaxID=2852117 RepID=UPI001EF09112|nr:hypothetical protein [Halomonas profundi]
MDSENKMTYQEVDFLLPAQRFNIQFSYVTQKGLPFIREFVLRLVHIAPMSKSQIATYFGLSRLETEEAVSDLVQRGELALSDTGRLMLTGLSQGYFTDLGETPQLSAVLDSGATLSFDLASFSCFSNQNVNDGWRAGISLEVDRNHISQSEKLVEKHFQHQFSQILEKDFLPKAVSQDSKERPYVYTVNAVNKLRDLPLRLTTKFKVGKDGKSVERDNFEQLNDSEIVHGLIAVSLSKLVRPSNTMALMQAMNEIGDEDTLKVFDPKTNSANPRFIDDLQKLEEYNEADRKTFVGQIYTQSNWEQFQSILAPLLARRIKTKSDHSDARFTWIAPSDPFWAKNDRVREAISEFINRASTKDKQLYKQTLYVPVFGPDDTRAAKSWCHEFRSFEKSINGLSEGMLGGSVEIIHLEGELVVVVYHFSQPETLPVSMPIGFISTNKATVERVGRLVHGYVDGSSSFDRPNDCGSISSIAKSR